VSGDAPKPPNRVQVEWAGGQRFDAGRPGGPRLRIDASGETSQGPVDAVLSGLASCISVDVVEILAKRRTPVARLAVDVEGERVTTIPRRLRRIRLEFHVDGEGIERVHAERAIDLAITKYCSVRDSLAPDIRLEWALTLNGEQPDGPPADASVGAGLATAERAGRS
jgi:putative redox protein